ncbi:MAG: desulfoferrodoxin family protein [Christensenellales bacterium]
MKFYVCAHCGNVVAYAVDSGVKVVCCGEEMKELIPGTVEASKEKHIPVIEQQGNLVTVKVGSVAHPMTEGHYIGWIALETAGGNQRRQLDHLGAPEAKFALLEGDKVLAAYAWCNLHGLWKAEA